MLDFNNLTIFLDFINLVHYKQFFLLYTTSVKCFFIVFLLYTPILKDVCMELIAPHIYYSP